MAHSDFLHERRSSDPKKHCYFQCDYVETVSDYTDDIDLKPYNQLFAFLSEEGIYISYKKWLCHFLCFQEAYSLWYQDLL